MMTIRRHDQFNATVYTKNDRCRGVHGSRRVIFVNVEDLRDLGLEKGQRVDIHSHWPNEKQHTRTAKALTLV
jgi:anaerobic selenocysteine-containing dehydrogenase